MPRMLTGFFERAAPSEFRCNAARASKIAAPRIINYPVRVINDFVSLAGEQRVQSSFIGLAALNCRTKNGLELNGISIPLLVGNVRDRASLRYKSSTGRNAAAHLLAL